MRCFTLCNFNLFGSDKITNNLVVHSLAIIMRQTVLICSYLFLELRLFKPHYFSLTCLHIHLIPNFLRSKVNDANKNKNESKDDENWTITCASITFALTFLVVIGHFTERTANLFVGTRIEGGLCVILAIFWAAVVVVVSDSKKGLAVNEEGAVINGNLYFFSWAGFVCSVTLLISYLRSAQNIDIIGEMKNHSRLTIWAVHLSASIVVMGSSADIYDNSCCSGCEKSGNYCNKTFFGILLGTISTFVALSIIATRIAVGKFPFLIEACSCLLLVVSYGAGVAFLTAESGPAAPLGNLYYFSWISFVSVLMLGASCVDSYQTDMLETPDCSKSDPGLSDDKEISTRANSNSEIEVEELDEEDI